MRHSTLAHLVAKRPAIGPQMQLGWHRLVFHPLGPDGPDAAQEVTRVVPPDVADCFTVGDRAYTFIYGDGDR